MHKSTERILDERFLLLGPGELIGLRVPLRTSCPTNPHAAALAPGDYEVTVTYRTDDVCLPDLTNREAKFPILQSTVEGDPIHIRLTE